MILSQNKSLLSYLYKAIQHRKMGTVGFYVGGMKDAALKATESCSIVLATYAMAAEALDIKTLTTLFLATPRTDVRQAVGRILREKHERPLVVDVVDMHDVFQSQWRKRLAYYRKQGYRAIEMTSSAYPQGKWKDVSTARTTKKRSAPRKSSGGGVQPSGACLLQLSASDLA
jgi:hypothetical protein